MTNSVPDEGSVVGCGNGVRRAGMRELIDSVRPTILVNAEMGAESVPLNNANCGADVYRKLSHLRLCTKTADSDCDDV